MKAALVLSLAGLYFFSFIQRVGIPGSIFNDLQSEMNLDAAAVTRLGAIYLFVYASMQPFVGLLADRFGGSRVALASGVLLVAGAAMFPISHGIEGLYFSRALVGLGGSAMFLCMFKEASRWFSGRHFTVIVGSLSLVGYCGGLAGTSPFRMLADRDGWRSACLVLAAGTALFLALTGWLSWRIGHAASPVRIGKPWRNTVDVLTNRLNLPVLAAFSLSSSVALCLQMTIGQKFIGDFCEITALEATKLTFVMMLFTLATLPVCGVVSKRFRNLRKPFLIFMAAAAVAGTALILVGIHWVMPPWFFLCALIPMAIGSGSTPVILSMMREQNHPQAVATSVGLLNASVYLMIALTTQVSGRVLEAFHSEAVITRASTVYPPAAYGLLFAILLAIATISLIASLFSRETHGHISPLAKGLNPHRVCKEAESSPCLLE